MIETSELLPQIQKLPIRILSYFPFKPATRPTKSLQQYKINQPPKAFLVFNGFLISGQQIPHNNKQNRIKFYRHVSKTGKPINSHQICRFDGEIDMLSDKLAIIYGYDRNLPFSDQFQILQWNLQTGQKIFNVFRYCKNQIQKVHNFTDKNLFCICTNHYNLRKNMISPYRFLLSITYYQYPLKKHDKIIYQFQLQHEFFDKQIGITKINNNSSLAIMSKEISNQPNLIEFYRFSIEQGLKKIKINLPDNIKFHVKIVDIWEMSTDIYYLNIIKYPKSYAQYPKRNIAEINRIQYLATQNKNKTYTLEIWDHKNHPNHQSNPKQLIKIDSVQDMDPIQYRFFRRLGRYDHPCYNFVVLGYDDSIDILAQYNQHRGYICIEVTKEYEMMFIVTFFMLGILGDFQEDLLSYVVDLVR